MNTIKIEATLDANNSSQAFMRGDGTLFIQRYDLKDHVNTFIEAFSYMDSSMIDGLILRSAFEPLGMTGHMKLLSGSDYLLFTPLSAETTHIFGKILKQIDMIVIEVKRGLDTQFTLKLKIIHEE